MPKDAEFSQAGTGVATEFPPLPSYEYAAFEMWMSPFFEPAVSFSSSESQSQGKSEGERRLELAERRFGESQKFMDEGDVGQSSEKLYKVAEECIKLLAEKHGLNESMKAKEKGRWFADLLWDAARKLSDKVGEERIWEAWKEAANIHVWGFHENKWRIEDVRRVAPSIEWLLNYIKRKE